MEEQNLSDFYNGVGSKVRSIRKAKDFSQAQLSYKSGVEIRQIGRIERGQTDPRLGTLLLLAAALEVSLLDFFDFS